MGYNFFIYFIQYNVLRFFDFDVCFFCQVKVKYILYFVWGYFLYVVFILVFVICIVYLFLKDYFVCIKLDVEVDEMLSESNDFVLCCCVGGLRIYNVLLRNSIRINGYVNLIVVDDDG